MKDEKSWLRAAFSDDTLVAELLLRLKDSGFDHPLPSAVLPPPTWGLRQRRSKSAEKKGETRRSPTTPLSWAACSASPSDGYEESSHPSDRFRSKVSVTTDMPTTTSKRPRRKKTFAELKEEESLLMTEQTHLKKELAKLHQTLKDQRSRNENLKRMKLDLHERCAAKSEANPKEADEQTKKQNRPSEATSSNTSRQVDSKEASTSDSFHAQTLTRSVMTSFVLPDLNMMPEEECFQGGIIGMS